MNEVHEHLYKLLVSPDTENEYLENLHIFIHKNKSKILLKNIYPDGDTILHLIASRGLDEIIDILKSYFDKNVLKKIVNTKNVSSIAALHIASCYGYTDVCKKLLNLGASLNYLTDEKNSPIHFAIVNGHIDTVKFLIEAGADLSIPNSNGNSPYKLIFKHMKSLIDYILNKKRKYIARVSISDKKVFEKSKYITNSKINYNRENFKIQIRDTPKTSFCIPCKYKPSGANCKTNCVIPERNIEEEKSDNDTNIIRRLNSINKDQNLRTLVSLKDIKGRKILVEYKYDEITDNDISKFINREKKEVISHPWFQTLIDFYWYSFGKKLFIIQLSLYLFYTLMFCVNSSYLTDPIENITYNEYTNGTYYNTTSLSSNDIADEFIKYFSTIMLVLINLFHTVNESLEIRRKRSKAISYFKNKWNVFDLTQIILVYASFIAGFISREFKIRIVSLLYPIFFIKILSFSRGFRTVGPMVRVIFKMFRDMYNFMAILAAFLVGFSQAFYVLLNNNPEFSNPFISIRSSFDMIIDNFDGEIIENSDFPIMANLLYRLYAIIAIIMLLNMLIAILSDSYTEIIDEAEKEWKIERAKLIVSLMDNLLSYKNKYTTVEEIEYLISLEPDNVPIKGIENFELEFTNY